MHATSSTAVLAGPEEAAVHLHGERRPVAATLWVFAEPYAANIKEVIGNKWARRMGKLFDSVQFESDHLTDEALRGALMEHNFKVEVRWLSEGGDFGRTTPWHVTKITLDHLRPSPEWERQGKELAAVKEAEALILRGQRELAEGRWREAEKRQWLAEVADELRQAGGQYEPAEADPF